MLDIVETEERDQLEKTIRTYFEFRYRSLSTLKLENINEMVEDSQDGNAFLRKEADKLEIEIYHAKRNHLRYIKYGYSLDFKEVSIDPLAQIAHVSVVEGHDVVFEISAPIISSMRNLKHSIILHKKNGKWKIITDTYEDFLWHQINKTGKNKEEFLQLIDETQNTPPSSEIIGYTSRIDQQSLSTTSWETYPYDRDGAVAYAHE